MAHEALGAGSEPGGVDAWLEPNEAVVIEAVAGGRVFLQFFDRR